VILAWNVNCPNWFIPVHNISYIPYDLILTTKFNDSSILTTIISWDYIEYQLRLSSTCMTKIFSRRISQSDCSIQMKIELSNINLHYQLLVSHFLSYKLMVNFLPDCITKKIISILPLWIFNTFILKYHLSRVWNLCCIHLYCNLQIDNFNDIMLSRTTSFSLNYISTFLLHINLCNFYYLAKTSFHWTKSCTCILNEN
jgi:hypothetical protein